MLKSVAPDPDLIDWLWSSEGIFWHRNNIRRVAHAYGAFAEVKRDHECYTDYCAPSPFSPYIDEVIVRELRTYGISGLPEEWKELLECCKEV